MHWFSTFNSSTSASSFATSHYSALRKTGWLLVDIGERYMGLSLLIVQLSVAGQSPAYLVLYTTLPKLAGGDFCIVLLP